MTLPSVRLARRAARSLRALVCAVVLAAGVAGPALACPVCASSATLTPAQTLINADRAVLGRPAGGRLRVEAVIKGPGAPDDQLDLPIPLTRPGADASRPILVVRDGLSREWAVLGDVDAGQADWLRSLGTLKRTNDMNAADWRERVARFLPYLEHPEPLIAGTAYGEISRAPYEAMRAHRERLDAARLAAWVEDPALVERRPLYLLLLGLAGSAQDAQRIESALDTRRPDADRADLPALIAADLELRGPAQLGLIEKQWLLNARRSLLDVQAALVALSVHGNEGGRLSRAQVTQAYLRLIRQRPQAAGLVAQDLASWQVWEATPLYASVVERSDLSFASRVAIAQYLRLSPHPQAAAALQRAMRFR